MEEVVNYGALSLIPPLLAVFLAFKTKNVVLSLLVALFSGALIMASWNPWIGMQDMFSNYLFVNITDSGNAQTIVMMSFVGGFVALLEKSGGARAFAQALAKRVKSKSTAQTFAWVGGLSIFFSDSGNSLIMGPIFRPIMDRLKVSRAKLAYILDSTSSADCILVPITGWGVYIMSIIATEFDSLGIEGSDIGTFISAIPYQFYAFSALLLVLIVAVSKRDFGPMVKSEEIAQHGLTEEQKAAGEQIVVSEDTKVSAWNMGLPIIVLFVTIFVMFFSWGWPAETVAGAKIRVALTSGYFLSSIVLGIMIIKQKLMTFSEVFDTFIHGIKNMAGILVIIICAWGVGSVCSNMGTSEFIVNSTIDIIPASMVPAMLFLIGSVISFATGTSWGTMAILLPLGIHMAYGFELSQCITIAAVLSGSLFGDHCAPISDTTVLSSMAAGCNHIEHVKTQLPYALLAAISAFISYLILGFTGLSAAIALPGAICILIVLFLIACKLFGKKTA